MIGFLCRVFVGFCVLASAVAAIVGIVAVVAWLVERRGKDMALYQLLDGSNRHILHVVDGDCHSILEVSETGWQRISLDEYLNRS